MEGLAIHDADDFLKEKKFFWIVLNLKKEEKLKILEYQFTILQN